MRHYTIIKASPTIEVTTMSNDSLSDEDKALFHSMMQAVKPLAHTKKLVVKTAPSLRTSPRKATPIEKPTTNYNLSSYYHEVVNADSILTYCKQSIPRKRLGHLKSGQIPWQARLDLHGLRPDDAREMLCHFIEQQCHIGNRCLIIIHGKGGLHGEAPVLKNLVNHWLKQLQQVLAFHSALPRDGGGGALYVLLQRKCEE